MLDSSGSRWRTLPGNSPDSCITMPGESEVLASYLTGLALGSGLITPIGPQNVFVVGQGLSVGFRRAVWAVIAAGCCDTTLIIAGAAGVSGLLTAAPAARTALLLAGAIFLAPRITGLVCRWRDQLVVAMVPIPGWRRHPPAPVPARPCRALVRPFLRNRHARLRGCIPDRIHSQNSPLKLAVVCLIHDAEVRAATGS